MVNVMHNWYHTKEGKPYRLDTCRRKSGPVVPPTGKPRQCSAEFRKVHAWQPQVSMHSPSNFEYLSIYIYPFP